MENRKYNISSKVEVYFEKQFKNSKIEKKDEKIKYSTQMLLIICCIVLIKNKI